MTYFDILLFGILLCFAVAGFARGLIRTLGALIGVFGGMIIAGKFTAVVYKSIDFLDGSRYGYAIVFFLVFAVSSKIIHIIFMVIDRIFRILSIIPFAKSVNRLAGAALGFCEGILLLGVIFFALSRFPLSQPFREIIRLSTVPSAIFWISSFATAWVPDIPGVISWVSK